MNKIFISKMKNSRQGFIKHLLLVVALFVLAPLANADAFTQGSTMFVKFSSNATNWPGDNAVLKVKFYGGTSGDSTIELTKLAENSYYCKVPNGNYTTCEILRYNSEGTTQWNKMYGISASGSHNCVTINANPSGSEQSANCTWSTIVPNLYIYGSATTEGWNMNQNINLANGASYKTFTIKNSSSVQHFSFYFDNKKQLSWRPDGASIKTDGSQMTATESGEACIIPANSGTVTLTIVSADVANQKVVFTATAVPSRVLYCAYKYESEGTWKFTADGVSVNSTNWSFDIPVKNGEKVSYRFMTDKSALNATSASSSLYAPIQNTSALSGNSVSANAGASEWWYTPDFNGKYHVEAEFSADDKLKFSLTKQEQVIIVEGDFLYTLDGGSTWTKINNKVAVQGQYTQWSVTLKNQNGKLLTFKTGNTVYGVHADNNFELNETQRYEFRNMLSSDYKPFEFKKDFTYQFIIRKFDEESNYQILVRRVEDDTFQAYGVTSLKDDFSADHELVDIADGKAAAKFNAAVTNNGGNLSVEASSGYAGEEVTYHWVKYEHPYFGGESYAKMVNPLSGTMSLADAIYWSDTYLHDNDPRLAHLTPTQREAIANGERTWSVDKQETTEVYSQNVSEKAIYRVYAMLKKNHNAGEKRAAAAPIFRAPITTTSGEQFGSRVAFNVEMTDNPDLVVTGVDQLGTDAEAAEAEFFTLSGIRVNGVPAAGIYIVRRGDKVSKVVIR